MTGADQTEVALQRLRTARRVLVTSHSSPDGDAIGSELALCELANQLGVETVIVNRDPAPGGLEELPGAEQIVVSHTLPSDFPSEYDLVITVECPGLDRPGLTGLDQLPILNIDHHAGNEEYGEVNFLDDTAPAVGEMVWRLFRAASIEPSNEAALNAYVALSTDTGDFQYSNATPTAFAAAADMVRAGADPVRAAELAHHRKSPSSVRLCGEVMSTLELREGGRLAIIEASLEAFARAEAKPQDTEDLVNLPRAIAGVEVVVFFKQWKPGLVRVSLRSKGDLDVREIAALFGGGGHSAAAGCAFDSDLSAAKSALIPRLTSLFKEA